MNKFQLQILIKLEICKVELVQAQARAGDNQQWLGERCQEIIHQMMDLQEELEKEFLYDHE